ncbi:hypothetical protein ES702_01345 [subsurface metagenome]
MDKDKEAFLETSKYIYSNPITRWITLKGHQACARLRQYDIPGVTVVDLGCGEGDHFPFVKKADILGIDILPEMLERAKRKYLGRAKLMQADIFSISKLLPPGNSQICCFCGNFGTFSFIGKSIDTEKKGRDGDKNFKFKGFTCSTIMAS